MIRDILYKFFMLTVCSAMFCGCRKDEPLQPSVSEPIDSAYIGEVKGFFLLNEGNMGSNKATLDFCHYNHASCGCMLYKRNIYPERNPSAVMELGDVGNDIKIYGNKLYAVINCSNKVTVMNVRTAVRIGEVAINNCRSIVFHGKYAYVSSYAGPVAIDPNARLGYVARIDTASLQIDATCATGYQPEEMTVRDNKLYVANSGGYRAPNYDNSISVIDLDSFTEIRKITVGINLRRMVQDRYGNIYVSSAGNYDNIKSNLYVIDRQDRVANVLNVEASAMTLCGDSLYVVYGIDRNHSAAINASYTLINTLTKTIVSTQFIDNESKTLIKTPYGIAVHPENGEILIADADNYITPGRLFRLNRAGKLLQTITTGDIPAHIAFTRKELKTR
ncbi:MAG: YncE family protein [Prevotellaceae bacterium]|jgi:hypothetical protein|nr:YncE family protein [Prevotellaceae bacterium]